MTASVPKYVKAPILVSFVAGKALLVSKTQSRSTAFYTPIALGAARGKPLLSSQHGVPRGSDLEILACHMVLWCDLIGYVHSAQSLNRRSNITLLVLHVLLYPLGIDPSRFVGNSRTFQKVCIASLHLLDGCIHL